MKNFEDIQKAFEIKVFGELNEINEIGYPQIPFEKEVKKLSLPSEIKDDDNYLAYQETKVCFGTATEEQKERIVEYFTKLGEHLANNQDGVFVNMKTDCFGVDKVTLTFPRVG